MSRKQSSHKAGVEGERLAETYLKKCGYDILERNVRFPIGEIDFVAHQDGALVFIEVKTRRSVKYGLPEEAVHSKKQQKMIQLASWYLARVVRRGGEQPPSRFDVLSILLGGELEAPTYRLIKNAFEVR